jgi:hypothetical protein
MKSRVQGWLKAPGRRQRVARVGDHWERLACCSSGLGLESPAGSLASVTGRLAIRRAANAVEMCTDSVGICPWVSWWDSAPRSPWIPTLTVACKPRCGPYSREGLRTNGVFGHEITRSGHSVIGGSLPSGDVTRWLTSEGVA